jgi:hypothetical protein
MPATELSGPLPPEQFTQTLLSRHHGTEYGIRGDTDGTAFGITLPPSGDEATFGSATVDSICKVGGYPLIIPKTTPHSLEILPALTGGTTGRTDLVVARFAPATYTTTPGPVRLFCIPGTPGSLNIPAHNAGTDLPLWAVRRKQGEALNQAIATDMRSWTGIPVLVASGAPLPLNAPLGARATRDGITHRMDFVDSGVDWVEEWRPIETLSGTAATESAGTGWSRPASSRLVRNSKHRQLTLVVHRSTTSITADANNGGITDALLAKLFDEDKPPVETPAVVRVRTNNNITFGGVGHISAGANAYLDWMAPGITIGPGGEGTPDDTVILSASWYVA